VFDRYWIRPLASGDTVRKFDYDRVMNILVQPGGLERDRGTQLAFLIADYLVGSRRIAVRVRCLAQAACLFLALSAPLAVPAAVKNEPPYWFNDADDRATVYFLSSDDLPVGAYLGIFGDDFGSSGQVLIGSTQATVAAWSARRIVVTVPSGATGAVTVQPAGGQTSDPFPLTVRAGRVRHLSASAAAGGDGTAPKPWNDFATANAAVVAGDFVVVHAGTYNGGGAQYAWDITKSGTAGNTITWFVAPGEVALVDGATATKTAIRIDGAWVNVVGFVARGSEYQNIYLNGVSSRAIDCEAREGNGAVSTKGQGINISAAGAKALGNYVHDNYSHGFYAYATDMEIGYNYVATSGCCGAPVNYGYGIQLYVVDPGPTFTHPRVYRNFVTTSNRGGIVVGQYSDGADVYENIVRGNDERGLIVGYGAKNTRIRNNVFYHNDVDAAGYYEVDFDTGTSVEFVNNAVAGAKAVSKASTFGGTIRCAYNDYFGTNGWRWNGTVSSTIAAWRTATAQDGSSLTADPQFRNFAANDFRLAAGSLLVDAGESATCARTPQGTSCDIGAFENAGGTAPGGPATPQNLRRADIH